MAALTFDDAPDCRFTPELLDVLDRHGVRATFFVIGRQVDSHPEVAREIVERGHAIGNHTHSHSRGVETRRTAELAGELEQCRESIRKATGRRTHLFRPPRGRLNETVMTAAVREDYEVVLWTVCANQKPATTPELMAERVLEQARPGMIILLHVGTFTPRWKDVAATSIIISELRKRGYRFVTLPDLFGASANAGVADRPEGVLQ